MGTANFLNVNASKVYACDVDDEVMADITMGQIIHDINEELKKSWVKGWDIAEVEKWTNERSYPSKIFGEVYKYFEFYGVEVTAQINLIIRSGYYQGCNFDYEFEFEVDGTTYDSIDEVERDFEEYASDYAGKAEHLLRYHLSSFIRKLEDEIGEVINIVEKVYAEHTIGLCKVAQFSNGEAIYEVCEGA